MKLTKENFRMNYHIHRKQGGLIVALDHKEQVHKTQVRLFTKLS